jgi:ATP-dependent RNA helicase DDX5/DBP2
MTSSAYAPASNGPRYAPPDPTLPKPWRGLIDGNTGYLYFWNPETKVTQYERPVAAVPNSPPQPPGYSRPEERPRSSTPSEVTTKSISNKSQNYLFQYMSIGSPLRFKFLKKVSILQQLSIFSKNLK